MLAAQAGSYKQTLATYSSNFHKGSKDAEWVEHKLPAWSTLVVSESEESVDELELPVHIEESKTKRKSPPKLSKVPDHDHTRIARSRQKVRRGSSRIPSVYSASTSSRGCAEPRSLQEVLQAAFSNNGSFNVAPPAVTPIDSEGSCADLPVTAPSRKRRLVPVVEITPIGSEGGSANLDALPRKRRLVPIVEITRRGTSEQSADLTALPRNRRLMPVVETTRRSTSEQSDTVPPFLNATTGTAAPKAALRRPAIPYESIQDVVDAALDTQVASITWHTPSYTAQNISHTKRVHFEDAIFHFDGPTSCHEIGLESAPAEDGRRALPLKFTRMLDRVAAGPRQSGGDGFNERLFAMFGGVERPPSPAPEQANRVTADLTSAFALAREGTAGKVSSPASSSGLTTTSDTSLAQNTDVTSVASNLHDVSRKRVSAAGYLEDEPVRKKQKIEVDEDKVSEWVIALQQLVKGKIRIDQKGMNHLSLVLAEIESLYPHVGSELEQVSSLQGVLQKLAQLENIPFRDEHGLRRRSKEILTEWPLAKA